MKHYLLLHNRYSYRELCKQRYFKHSTFPLNLIQSIWYHCHIHAYKRNKVLHMDDSVNHLLFHGFTNPFLLITSYFLNDLIHLIAQWLDLLVPCWQHFSPWNRCIFFTMSRKPVSYFMYYWLNSALQLLRSYCQMMWLWILNWKGCGWRQSRQPNEGTMYLPGRDWGKPQKTLSRYPVSRSRFENKNGNHLTVAFDETSVICVVRWND
jgi:hypothetical protein